MSMVPVPVGAGVTEPLGTVIQEVSGHVTYLADRLYSEYEPTRGPFPDFWQRLEKWFENLEREDDQQLLFRLLPEAFFVGPREFESLYRVAFNEQIAVWLIDQLGMVLNADGAADLLRQAVKETWFCPITDSMRINAFYHLNHIVGRDYRPDWRSLYKFGSIDKITKYMSQWGIKRLVLLEDFVGNGGQIQKAVDWASKFPGQVPLLVVPLVLCPCGLPFMQELQQKYNHVRVSPCIVLPGTAFIEETPRAGESPLFTGIRRICISATERMKEGLTPDQVETANKYLPFGWKKTGGLIVLYTNCPNNTLPIVFHGSHVGTHYFPAQAEYKKNGSPNKPF
jgi:hypothetical protein